MRKRRKASKRLGAYMTVTQFANYVGVSRSAVWSWLREGMPAWDVPLWGRIIVMLNVREACAWLRRYKPWYRV